MNWPNLLARLVRFPGGFRLGVCVEFRPLARCGEPSLPPAPVPVEAHGEAVKASTSSNVLPLRRRGRAA